jgi:hypothetical protein
MSDRIIVPYPVDKNAVDMQFTAEEESYDMDLEKNVSNGIVNPRVIRWFFEDPNNPEPRIGGPQLKYDYRTCNVCSRFDQTLKICDEVSKHIPSAIQFKEFKCPLDKWK